MVGPAARRRASASRSSGWVGSSSQSRPCGLSAAIRRAAVDGRERPWLSIIKSTRGPTRLRRRAAAPPEAMPEDALPVVLDRERVLPDQRLAEVPQAGGDGLLVALQGRLAPAVQAPVGHDLDEDPVARLAPGRVDLYVGDVHLVSGC